jgi:hypothetical protein
MAVGTWSALPLTMRLYAVTARRAPTGAVREFRIIAPAWWREAGESNLLGRREWARASVTLG